MKTTIQNENFLTYLMTDYIKRDFCELILCAQFEAYFVWPFIAIVGAFSLFDTGLYIL